MKKIVQTAGRNALGTFAPECAEFEMVPGKGVKAVIDGKQIACGNEKFVAESGLEIQDAVRATAAEQLSKGATVTYVLVNGVLAGLIALSDSLRSESRSTIERLHALGVTPVLLTGDNNEAANQIAAETGITEVHANCLPEDKLSVIDQCQNSGEYSNPSYRIFPSGRMKNRTCACFSSKYDFWAF